jgi:hypothetical protein
VCTSLFIFSLEVNNKPHDEVADVLLFQLSVARDRFDITFSWEETNTYSASDIKSYAA